MLLPDLEAVHRVLVVRQHDQLGDMLVAMPLFRALKKRFPGSTLTVIARPKNAEPLMHHPFIDSLLIYDKEGFWSCPKAFFGFLAELRHLQPDVAVVPSTNSFSATSALLAFLSGAPIRIGARRIGEEQNPFAFLFSHPIDLDWESEPHRHQSLRNLDNARFLDVPMDDLRLEMGFTEEELRYGQRRASELRGTCLWLVGFHIGGKRENRWPPEQFAQLADRLHKELDAAVFLTVGPVDAKPLERFLITAQIPHAVLSNLPIRLAASIIRYTNLYVTNDTGMMHLAASTGCRVLSLFGPTDPLQWAPFGDEHRYIRSESSDMEAIDVETVFAAAKEMLVYKP